MSRNIKFNIELSVDGKRVITQVSMSTKELAANLSEAQANGERLRKALISLNQIQQSFQNLTNGFQQLAAQMHEYTAANAAQVEAETKLATNMRNTMAATEAEIQSIRELTAAQQQLGVVGDEVQIAGAQELSLHLKKAETLRQLIPVMNDLIVKQDGLNVSSSTATSVASLLGKAMDAGTRQGNLVMKELSAFFSGKGSGCERLLLLLPSDTSHSSSNKLQTTLHDLPTISPSVLCGIGSLSVDACRRLGSTHRHRRRRLLFCQRLRGQRAPLLAR